MDTKKKGATTTARQEDQFYIPLFLLQIVEVKFLKKIPEFFFTFYENLFSMP